MKSESVSVKPKTWFVWYLLKNRLNTNPEIMIIQALTRKVISGLKYRPEIIPIHNGRPIRRNGISLCSTVCS
jgi:hypothetical protein